MKPVIFIAIVLLSLFLIPMTLAIQQSIQIPKTMASKPGFDFNCVTCGATVEYVEPGSGGGGQGVI